ncbi:MAG: hypothetical protein AB7U05_18355, partial [Mangrovibacterium sp.]
ALMFFCSSIFDVFFEPNSGTILSHQCPNFRRRTVRYFKEKSYLFDIVIYTNGLLSLKTRYS